MKPIILALFLLVCGSRPGLVHAQSTQPSAKNTLRIMSYNIRNAMGMDRVTDFDRLAGEILDVAPDVVALQEIDSATRRSQSIDVLHEIADRVLMHRVYAPAIEYDGGKYGIGVLSKEKPLQHRSLPLPGREEERALLLVEFEQYLFACTHLSLTDEDRMASLQIIAREAAASGKPFILAGDLNARPDSPFMTALAEQFDVLTDTEKPTFPADTPTECIDYIAVYKTPCQPYTLLSRFVPEAPMASDHRPVVADIRWKTPKEAIFRTNPYLQNPVDEGMTIMWQTWVPTYSWVEYGTDTLHLTKVHTLVDGQVICNGTQNKIRLTGLAPGQTYYYRVCSQEIMLYQAYKKEFGETAVSPFSTFTLPPASATDFTAIIFNDLHKQVPTLKALYEQVKDTGYDFVVFNGDCVDDPATEDVAISHMSIQCEVVGADRVPVFYLRGNHEIRNAYSIGLRDLFDYVGDKTYGAFNWGDTRIVMLDCGEDKPDDHWVYYGLNDFTQLRLDQVDFLEQELNSPAFKNASRRVLLNHIPVYGNGDAYSPCSGLWAPCWKKRLLI